MSSFQCPCRNSCVLERLRANPVMSWMPIPQKAGDFRPDCSYGFEVLIEIEVWKAGIFLTYVTVVRIQVFWQTSEAEQFQQSSLPLHEWDLAFPSLTFLLAMAAPSRARVLLLPSGSPLIQLNRDFSIHIQKRRPIFDFASFQGTVCLLEEMRQKSSDNVLIQSLGLNCSLNTDYWMKQGSQIYSYIWIKKF